MTAEGRHERTAFLNVEKSLTGRRWAARLSDERLALAMAQRHGLPDAICRLLAARNVGLESVPDFLEPTLRKFLPDPSHLKDMDAAVERLVRAVKAGEKIVVFGDYDVDGATSSALLQRFFRSAGANIGVYIPDRRKEGYGPNAPALLKLKEQGAAVVVTVDCGVTAYEPLAEARKVGLDVIVIDHHQAEMALPEAVAVVDESGCPIAMLGRQRFMDRFAKPFFREIYGRQPCLLFANLSPRLVELRSDIEALTDVLTSEDQRYLSEGFVLTENGQYKGLGRGHDLVRAVTESRIEAARHANPLTLLPGNIPLTQHIARLLESGRDFVASYCDLNQFKPFNDIYGYWRGDEMIQLAARCIARQADSRRDFVGHVGGDDFVVLFQSADWEARCQAIIDSFNQEARALYDEDALRAGGLVAEDRFGTPRFHPLTSMSIGVVRVPPHDEGYGPEDVADAAAQAKRIAKANGFGMHVLHSFRAAGRGAAPA